MSGRIDDPDERHRLVTQAWDLPDLDAQYRAYLERFEPVHPDSPGDALAHLTHLHCHWRRLLPADPGLPPSPPPAGWSGEQARHLLIDRHQRMAPLAIRWWQDRESSRS